MGIEEDLYQVVDPDPTFNLIDITNVEKNLKEEINELADVAAELKFCSAYNGRVECGPKPRPRPKPKPKP